jgi:hypothetical protein
MESSARKAVEWHTQHATRIRARRKYTARHEAGHAVIARVLGLLGGSATIVANHLQESYGGAESYLVETIWYWRNGGNKKLMLRSLACAYRARVIMEMAGYEAELECLGRSRGRTGGDSEDCKEINERMLKIYPGMGNEERFRRRNRLRRMTRLLVRRHRDKIERVACALLRHRTLSRKAINDLLPEIPIPVPSTMMLWLMGEHKYKKQEYDTAIKALRRINQFIAVHDRKAQAIRDRCAA